LSIGIADTIFFHDGLVLVADKSETEFHSTDHRSRFFDWIYRQRNNVDISGVKSGHLTLQLTELHIAGGSPMATVKYQHDGLRALAEAIGTSTYLWKIKIRSHFSQIQRFGRKVAGAIGIEGNIERNRTS
jgi:hypothetical protein